MKYLSIFIVLLASTSSQAQDYSNYSNWPYEFKQLFKDRAKTVIDKIFPRIEKEEKWSWDSYEYGSISIADITVVSTNETETTINLTGKFMFTRKGIYTTNNNKGTFTAVAKITDLGTLYMKEVCNTLDGRCHETEDWAAIGLQ